MPDRKYTICVDFDGVLHSYTSPFDPNSIPDPPVPGAIEWLDAMQKKFNVCIFTTRAKTAEGKYQVAAWLTEHGFKCDPEQVGCVKIPALIYIDDRAYRFTGDNFPSAQEIHAMKPWNK